MAVPLLQHSSAWWITGVKTTQSLSFDAHWDLYFYVYHQQGIQLSEINLLTVQDASEDQQPGVQHVLGAAQRLKSREYWVIYITRDFFFV